MYWNESVVWSPGYFVSTVGLNEKQILAYVRWQMHQDSARIEWEQAVKEDQKDGEAFSSLGIIYGGLGRKEEAIEIGQSGAEIIPVSVDALTGLNILIDLIHIYTWTSEYGHAIDLMEYFLSIPSGITISLLQLNPYYNPLRDHPRFQKLVADN